MQFLLRGVLLAAAVLAGNRAFASDCISFADARHHIGTMQCVSGKVFHVKEGHNGVTFLDFCEDYEVCPFTVVMFSGDQRRVGDVRALRGQTIQIKGTISEYDGRAEIVLKNPEQLGQTATLLPRESRGGALTPTLPKDYDVENAGHDSAGKFKRPKKTKARAQKKQGAPISTDDASQ